MWYICVYIDLYMYFANFSQEAHQKAIFLITLHELFAIGYCYL